jgi:hypothetical protein
VLSLLNPKLRVFAPSDLAGLSRYLTLHPAGLQSIVGAALRIEREQMRPGAVHTLHEFVRAASR